MFFLSYGIILILPAKFLQHPRPCFPRPAIYGEQNETDSSDPLQVCRKVFECLSIKKKVTVIRAFYRWMRGRSGLLCTILIYSRSLSFSLFSLCFFFLETKERS